ncbi:MAG: hypothetical protein LBI15_00665 [Dysgonamonadaceae bacterium]|jgi:hypothetical protein|nr:hypothetical protein [Dysgonamonadaceae bacterium]
MKKLTILLFISFAFSDVYSQNYINSIDHIFQTHRTARPFYFTTEGVERETLFRALTKHIQGAAYSDGYFYLVRNRPQNRNNQQLIIIDEEKAMVVSYLTLDPDYSHPGGIQIYDNILAVPFTNRGKNAKLNFYSLENPIEPVLIGSYLSDSQSALCVGIISYGNNYLVARYYGRKAIKFYHFDKSFNKVAEQVWIADNQDKSEWQPFGKWQDFGQRYENMNLVQVRENSLSKPQYYLLMFHNNPEAIDVFSLSEPDLVSEIDIRMIARILLTPQRRGFRMGGGMRIINEETVEFFSTDRHIQRRSMMNMYPPLP